VLQAPYSPARSTMIANLVEPGEVDTAYAIENTAFNLQVAIGPVIGGVLVAAGGADLALAIDALTFLASAALVSRVRSRRTSVTSSDEGLLAQTREGIAYAARHPVARALTISLFIAIAFLALDDVALPFLVRDTLGGGPAAYGIAFGAFGIGMLAASLALAFRPGRSPASIYLGGLAVSGAGAIATGAAPALGPAVVFYGGTGVGNGMENIASNTLIQRHVSAAMLGRVFALVSTAAYAGSGVAALLGGFYLDATSPRTVLITGGLGGLAALALALGPLRRAERGLGSRRSEDGGREGG
jgi:predicted MFS family arabinose efflux permease